MAKHIVEINPTLSLQQNVDPTARLSLTPAAGNAGAAGMIQQVADFLLAQDIIKNKVDAKGKKVGHDAGVCTFTTLTPPEAGCSITFFLSGGEIATQFLNAPPPRKVAAIVGGTGIYRGASGEAVIVEGPKQTGTIIFRLTR